MLDDELKEAIALELPKTFHMSLSHLFPALDFKTERFAVEGVTARIVLCCRL